MMRFVSLKRASMLAILAGAMPLHAQSGGLLGDSGVTSGSARAPQAGSGDEEGGRSSGRRVAPRARVSDISPYLEVDQTAIWDLKGGNGDMLTYTTVAVGVSGSVQTQSVAIGADVRYAHQFGWDSNATDQDILSGIVNGRFEVVRNVLSLEAGALATRVRSDFKGATNALAGASSTDKVYSAYIGPNFVAPIGDLTVTGAYRLGYNRVDQGNGAAVALGLPVTGTFEESWLHNASASVGMQPGALPFGWSVGVGYVRESASQLDQRYEQKFARADVTFPVGPTVALVGGVGYEDIEISNRDALRDANGVPVRDSSGRFVTDANSPRRLSYDDDGLIWDAGVMWRPSPRLQAEARVGHRYGSMTYTGSLSWAASRRTSVSVALFDSIDSFGRALNGSLANLGPEFSIMRNPFSGDIGGCAFNNGQSGGACFNDTLTGIATANYRNRGIVAQIARQGDPWGMTLAAGYVRRKFIADSQSVLAGANGLVDQNYFVSFGVQRAIDAVSAFDAQTYFNYFDSGISGVGDVTNMGANASYRRTIWRRLQASAAIGVDSIDRKGQEAFISLLAQLGLRYQF
jgi:hypothetical protein